MLVTLYCDASFCSRTKTGGWAVWLRSDAGRIVRGGACPEYVAHAYEAELAAIFAGVHLALTQWPQTTAVLVRSDCRAALDIMRQQQRVKHPGARTLAGKIQALRTKKRTRLIPRWVKGHQHGEAVDAWLNRKVDALARDHMQRTRRAKQASTYCQPVPDEDAPVEPEA